MSLYKLTTRPWISVVAHNGQRREISVCVAASDPLWQHSQLEQAKKKGRAYHYGRGECEFIDISCLGKTSQEKFVFHDVSWSLYHTIHWFDNLQLVSASEAAVKSWFGREPVSHIDWSIPCKTVPYSWPSKLYDSLKIWPPIPFHVKLKVIFFFLPVLHMLINFCVAV